MGWPKGEEDQGTQEGRVVQEVQWAQEVEARQAEEDRQEAHLMGSRVSEQGPRRRSTKVGPQWGNTTVQWLPAKKQWLQIRTERKRDTF